MATVKVQVDLDLLQLGLQMKIARPHFKKRRKEIRSRSAPFSLADLERQSGSDFGQ